jgi:hypothetical protein
LCWFTPINVRHRKYRRAQLWFQPPSPAVDNVLAVARQQADWRSVQRGTTQHEILEGEDAAAFVDGDALEIPVYCRADAGDLSEEIPYALAVSLEVAPAVGLPIYDEIRARVRPRVPVKPLGTP